jgi:anti-anti-sigma factor
MLKVDIRSAPPAVTLFCAGRMTLGVEAETLRCVATSRSERHLLLEMSKVHGIDAAGLGLLVELHHWARRRSANLIVVNPSLRTHRMLALTRLDQVLNISLPVDGLQSEDSEDSMCMTA